MAGASNPKDRRSARIAIVEEHIRLENEHDLEGVLRTFGDTPRYDDEPWSEHYNGLSGVRLFYGQLMKALPDLEIEVERRHVTDDAILVEVIIRGTHLGGGAVFRPRDDESRSRFAVCIRSTPMTAWPAKKSTTTAAQY